MCQLQASLKGAQYKLAAYKRENDKLADGSEAAKAEVTGARSKLAWRFNPYDRCAMHVTLMLIPGLLVRHQVLLKRPRRSIGALTMCQQH